MLVFFTAKLLMTKNEWFVYIIRCHDKSLYTGITTDLDRRYKQHSAKQGAKFFRGKQALNIVYVENGHDRSSASKREYGIKRLKHAEKLLLIASEANRVNLYQVLR